MKTEPTGIISCRSSTGSNRGGMTTGITVVPALDRRSHLSTFLEECTTRTTHLLYVSLLESFGNDDNKILLILTPTTPYRWALHFVRKTKRL